MIVSVKRSKNKKVKIISLIVLVLMFVAYYQYMSNEYGKKKEEIVVKKKIETFKIQKMKLSKSLEKIIYKEIESSVDLIGQEYIKQVKIIKNKVIIILEPNTNIDAITVRYGSIALVKKSLEDTKIAIDIKYIVDSKYDKNLHMKKEMRPDAKK